MTSTSPGPATPEQLRTYKGIALLLATAAALTESPSLIDRMANALNPEPAVRAVKDALRVLDSELSQPVEKRRIEITQHQEGQKERPSILVKTEEGSLRLKGYLPGNETIQKFLEDVYVNTSLARRVGTLASAILVDAKLSPRVEDE